MELGAGAACGLLAIFAAWAGARRVFAVEPDAAVLVGFGRIVVSEIEIASQ